MGFLDSFKKKPAREVLSDDKVAGTEDIFAKLAADTEARRSEVRNVQEKKGPLDEDLGASGDIA